MKKFATLAAFAVCACGRSDPGPLAGTWQIGGIVPVTVQFRPGEEETMGIIEQVTYEVTGQTVLVKIDSGPMKGTSMRYTVTSPDTAQFMAGSMRRVR